MKSDRSKPSSVLSPLWQSTVWALLLSVLLTIVMIGCGGETRGTGGGTIGGRVVALDGGAALADVVVTDAGSGESTVTDVDGVFSLSLPQGSQVTTLLFKEPDGAVSSGTIQLDDATGAVSVVVVIDKLTNQALITIQSPTPVPTSPGAEPSPSPTPTAWPGVTPTPILPSTTPTATPEPCPADFNGDGTVNQDDFDQFTALFTAGDSAADFDGNGFVSGADYDAFLDAFAAGC